MGPRRLVEMRAPVTRRVLLALLLLATEVDTDEIGLSKGAANPADIGSRCAVMAGRDDRAYLDCAEAARRGATGGSATSPEGPRPDRPGWSQGGVRRPYHPRHP
jgi:hypothetical protein